LEGNSSDSRFPALTDSDTPTSCMVFQSCSPLAIPRSVAEHLRDPPTSFGSGIHPGTPVQTFDISVLGRFCWIDKLELYTALIGRLIHSPTEGFWATIYNGCRTSFQLEALRQAHHLGRLATAQPPMAATHLIVLIGSAVDTVCGHCSAPFLPRDLLTACLSITAR